MVEAYLKPDPGGLQGKLLRFNWLLALLTAAIAGVGGIMLYSVAGGKAEPWAAAHMYRFGAGFCMMLIIALIDIRWWYRMALPLYALVLVLLVLVPLVGVKAMGAQRWLEIGGFQAQPSEFMKIALVMALAAFYQWLDPSRVSKPHYLLIPLVLVLAPTALVVKQPDLGTATLIAAGGIAVLFLAGVHWIYFGLGIAGTLGAIPLLWQHLRGYQKERVLTFLEPERDPLGAGYHIIQSKIAVGSGGLTGKGLMAGTQSQLNFLPEKHTDFIFTTLAEELGFIGATGLIGLYLGVIALGIYIALRCRHRFGRLVAGGVTFMLFLYVFINMAMVTGLVPVVGVPLPLVSYGGTAMITLMAGIGLLLNVSVHRNSDLEAGGGMSAARVHWPVRKP